MIRVYNRSLHQTLSSINHWSIQTLNCITMSSSYASVSSPSSLPPSSPSPSSPSTISTSPSVIPPTPPSSSSKLSSVSPSPSLQTPLRQLYKTIDTNKQSLNLHHSNGASTQLLFVPVCNTEESFRKGGKDSLVRYIDSISKKKEL